MAGNGTYVVGQEAVVISQERIKYLVKSIETIVNDIRQLTKRTRTHKGLSQRLIKYLQPLEQKEVVPN